LVLLVVLVSLVLMGLRVPTVFLGYLETLDPLDLMVILAMEVQLGNKDR
jgi:hypothetical protein